MKSVPSNLLKSSEASIQPWSFFIEILEYNTNPSNILHNNLQAYISRQDTNNQNKQVCNKNKKKTSNKEARRKPWNFKKPSLRTGAHFFETLRFFFLFSFLIFGSLWFICSTLWTQRLGGGNEIRALKPSKIMWSFNFNLKVFSMKFLNTLDTHQAN